MKPLTVPAVMDSLSPVREYVREAARRAGLDPDDTYDVTLAVEELVVNTITHGYGEHGLTGEVTVSADRTGTEFVIRLEDNAPAFDPRTLAMPSEEELAKPIEERSIGGLGVYLAVMALDRFDYERVGDRNCTILAKKRVP